MMDLTKPRIEFDMYAVPPAPGDAWSYVLDSVGIEYRRGLVAFRLRQGQWPFVADNPEREHDRRRRRRVPIPPECGATSIIVVPDSALMSWRNEIVPIEPSREVPHRATARLTLWVRRQGGGGMVTKCSVHLDMLNGTYRIEGLHPALPDDVKQQAELKAAKLSTYLAEEVRNRDGDRPRPVTARERAEQIRRRPGKWQPPFPAHGRPGWDREVGDGVHWLLVVQRHNDGRWAWAVCRHDRDKAVTVGEADDAGTAMDEADLAVGAADRCDRCRRVRSREPWPLKRGDRCSPKYWKHCIRPRTSAAS